MNMTITGHHIEITPAIREYLEEKMTRIRRHFDKPMDISIILTIEKLLHKAEANVHINGRDFFVHTSQQDMYASIDEMADLLDRQVNKHREKQQAQRNGVPLKHLA